MKTGFCIERCYSRVEPYGSLGVEGAASGVVVGAVSAEGVTVVVSSVVEEDDS